MCKRKYEKSHAEIIWRVRQYFKKEFCHGKRLELDHVVERTDAAPDVSPTIVSKFKTDKDVIDWQYENEENITLERKGEVPENYSVIIRQAIRDLFLERKQVPSVSRIYDKTSKIKVEDVILFNTFDGADLSLEDSRIWVWSRSTYYRFMKRIGFTYCE